MRLVLIATLLLMIGCSQKTTTVSKETTTCTANKSETHQLCVEISDQPKSNNISKAYYLLDSEGNRIIEGVLDGGYVMWLDDQAVEIFQAPGMMPTEISKDEIIQIYVIPTGQMTSKAEYLSTTK